MCECVCRCVQCPSMKNIMIQYGNKNFKIFIEFDNWYGYGFWVKQNVEFKGVSDSFSGITLVAMATKIKLFRIN